MIRGSGLGSLNHLPGDTINRQRTSAFGATADKARPAAGLVSVENDPQQTLEMRSDSRANAAATAMLATEAKRTTKRIVVA